jgi:hypothetical protein
MIDAWVDAWMHLIAELRETRGEIDATMLARSRQAQAIAAINPTIARGRTLMNLDDDNGKSNFRWSRLSNHGERTELSTFDRAWLARLRQREAAWRRLDPTWSEPAIPNLRSLASIDIGPGQRLIDLLLSLRTAKPSAKWERSARQVASGPHGRAVKRALIHWLGTLIIPGDSNTRVRPWSDVDQYRHFCRHVAEDVQIAGSAEAAAVISFFDGHGPVRIWPGLWRCAEPDVPDPGMMSETVGVLVRGAAWMLANWRDKEAVASLQKTAATTLLRVSSGHGTVTYRSLLAANACILALGEIASPDAVQALGHIKLRARDARLSKQIAKAMEAAAERAGMTVEDLEELSAPDFGLDEVGVKSLRLGDFTARLLVRSTTHAGVELARADGTAVKTVPAAIKSDPKSRAALKQLKDLAKEAAQALPVHRQRIENLYFTKRSWQLALWRERFLDHPLVGTIARRLIWAVTAPDGAARSFLWHEGNPVDAEGHPVAGLRDDFVVRLWHPLEAAAGEVAAWRALLMHDKVVQPFKQAHRELYPLTDAERASGLYSNRFAGHILRQHQSVALARLRGWRATLRISADIPNDHPTHVRLPDYGLAAELWTEAAGGVDAELTDVGAYVFISTDRVRFRRLSAEAGGRDALGDPLPLEAVPPRVFSEVMRDVDLFIGVASIGNDPFWIDRGVEAEHPTQWGADYWRRHSEAALGVSGENRKQLLAEVIPSLAIAERCTLLDRYLVVRGRLRTYRIHLGSGNVLMDNDRYLCILPRWPSDVTDAFLPFEGDRMLSIILSKAVMLAADDQVRDRGILSQFVE